MGFLLSSMVAIGGFHWIAYVAQNFGQMPLPVAIGVLLLYCLVAAPQMVAFCWAGFHLRFGVERFPVALRPLFWAALYTAFEFLARFPKIFPEHLGNTLIAYPGIAQGASLGGVSLLSFLPLFAGASLYYLRKEGLRRGGPSAAAALALLAGLAWWGRAEIDRLRAQPSETLRVGFVQNNLDEAEKIAQRTSARAAFDQIVTHLISRSRELAASDPRPDLIVWPETAYPLAFPVEGQVFGAGLSGYANLVKAGVADTGIPLLFGGYEESGKTYNAAFLLDGSGRVLSTYRKNVLLVFGEYFPLDWLFPSLKSINPQMGDFGRGPGPVPLSFPFRGGELLLGVNICYEAILPEYMRPYAQGGARVLLNITKDSWFGNTFEPWQHFQLTAIRSIEHHLPTVRSTNTGLTGIVLPTGETKLISQPFQEAAAVVEVPVPLNPVKTPYTRFGEWFALLTVLGSVLGGFLARKRV